MNNTTKTKLRQDYLTFKYNNWELAKKYNITPYDIQKLEQTPSFRKVIKDWILWKRCWTCDVWKDTAKDFTIAQYNWDKPSYRKDCKYCRNIKFQNARVINPELRKRDTEYKRKRREKYPDRAKAITDRYRERHYEEILKRDRMRWRRKRNEEINLKLKENRGI